jgi:hypothetical protein
MIVRTTIEREQMVSPSKEDERFLPSQITDCQRDIKILLSAQPVVDSTSFNTLSAFASKITIMYIPQLLLLSCLLASCSAFQSSLPRFAVPKVRFLCRSDVGYR